MLIIAGELLVNVMAVLLDCYVEGQITLSSENADSTSEVEQGLIFWGEF
jgi:hypothetical protein